MNEIKLLDCTLRDGGYYNNWDFSENLVDRYLEAMSNCSVDYVELGFRSLSRVPFKGSLAFTTDDYLKKKIKSKKINLGVMINASEFINDSISPTNYLSFLNSLFPKKFYHHMLNFVRVACHESEILKTAKICDF